MNGEDDAATPACAGDRGPAPEDDQSSLQEVHGPWEAVSNTSVTVALDTPGTVAPDTITLDALADTDSPWAHGQTSQTGPSSPSALPAPAAAPASVAIASNAIRWTETPLEVELQPASEVTEDATEDVDIAPRQLQLTPDSIGEDYGSVHVVNQSAEEQVVIVSAQLPDGVALYVSQDEPHSATLLVTMDAAHAAASGQDSTDGAVLYIATASGTTTVQVTQSPAPYSSQGGQSDQSNQQAEERGGGEQ